MKKILILLVIFTTVASMAQSVGINADGSAANATAMLDVSSTTKGFLPPRMTYAQRDAITSPATGLMVYCSNCGPGTGEPQFYNGSSWVNMIGGTALGLVPDSPIIGTVSISGVSATIPFTAPINNGGAAITSYTVTSNPGEFTGSLSQSGSGSITINGLTPGTTYTFTVTATNSNGTSVASSASNSVTAILLTSRTLSFESNNGLPLSLYGTTWSSDGAWNDIRDYGGTVHSGTYSWMVNLGYNQLVELLNSANFNAKSIWVYKANGSATQITIKGYNSSNVLVGTVTTNLSSWSYQQININLSSVRKLVISTNASYCDMMQGPCDDSIHFDDLIFEQ